MDAAAEELREVVSFLHRQAPGRDDRFLIELGDAIQRLAENPYVGPLVAPEVRRVGLRRFPYNLVYEVQASDIYILAVAHQRRDPGILAEPALNSRQQPIAAALPWNEAHALGFERA